MARPFERWFSPEDREPEDEYAPALPPGHRIELPGRGMSFARFAEGPGPAAPTVVLLHGWVATGALNWYRCFDDLTTHFNVIAPDLRGHGRGLRSRRRFRIRDCADDVAAMLDALDVGPVTTVGYSMGGPVSQQLWRHHRELVDGMVLVATGPEFMRGMRERYAFAAAMSALAGTSRLGAAATVVPRWVIQQMTGFEVATETVGPTAEWARREMAGHSVRMLAEAGLAIATYSAKDWIGEIDVPTTVIVTEADAAVSPAAQLRMAMAIPGAHINRTPDGHVACVNPDFGRKVTDACLDVRQRIDSGWRPTPARVT